RGAFFLRCHGVLRCPGLSVCCCFVASFHDFARKIRVCLHCRANHMRGDAHTPSLEHIEQAWNSFFESVVVPLADGQVRIACINCWKRARCPGCGLCTRLELQRDGNNEFCAIGPELACSSASGPTTCPGQGLKSVEIPAGHYISRRSVGECRLRHRSGSSQRLARDETRLALTTQQPEMRIISPPLF